MNDMAFETGRTCLQVEPVDSDHAVAVGCPGATHRLIGRHGATYGFFMATGRVPGNDVKVPNWSSRKGIRALFVPAVIDDSGPQPFDGWLGL